MSNQPAAPASSSSLRITKIHIGYPDEYNGKGKTAQVWLDSVHLYLLINKALYCDDNRKISYTLLYMKTGSATTWAEVHCQQGFTNQSFGTFTDFKRDFEKVFGNTNVQQEAMNWLATTHIATGEQLQEYTNEFKLNVVHTKYDKTKDAATLMSYYSTGIPVGIMQHIQAMDTVPTTIAHWYKKATHFHLQREIAVRYMRALLPYNTRPISRTYLDGRYSWRDQHPSE